MKTTKKLICFALLVCLMAALCACSGDDGGGPVVDKDNGWILTEDGTLTVDREGSMPSMNTDAYDKSTWFSVKKDIRRVIIKSGATDICDTAFAECENLESVSIPSTVTKIGNSAFADSMRLKKISIPEGVTSIGTRAFDSCRGLEEVEISNTVTNIDSMAFVACDSVEKLSIGSGLKAIGHTAFGFGRVESIVLPEGFESAGDNAFAGCLSLKEISLPASVKQLGADVFPSCLEVVNYGGTVAQWEALTKGVRLNAAGKEFYISCSDGSIGTPPAEPSSDAESSESAETSEASSE